MEETVKFQPETVLDKEGNEIPLGTVTDQPKVLPPCGGMSSPPCARVPVKIPPGLEPLVPLNTLVVKQKLEWLEILCGCETNNKYKIRDVLGNELYSANENTDCLTRNCCGAARPFEVEIRDARGLEVIHISRPFAWGCWMCNCSLFTVTVESPPGVVVGTVEQMGGSCTPRFAVRNEEGQVALWVEGSECGYCCHFCSVMYNVLTADRGFKVGEINKYWGGLARELFSDGDNFGISFPPDLDVRMKAVLLGALFLIDFVFFERTQQ